MHNSFWPFIAGDNMRIDLLDPFNDVPFFTIAQFKQVAGSPSPRTVRLLFEEYIGGQRIIVLKRGTYMTHCFFDRHCRDKEFPAAVSAIQVPGSYLSLEFVLQRHHLLAETTYPVTSVTDQPTHVILNRVATFWYRHWHQPTLRDVRVSEYHGVRTAEARAAKALFDYLYLQPLPLSLRALQIHAPQELHVRLEEFSARERREFGRLVEQSRSRRIRQFLENLRVNTWRH